MARNPFISALLSILVPGLGQLYNVQLVKGAICFGIYCVLWAVNNYSPLPGTPLAFAVSQAFFVLLLVYAIVDAFVVSLRSKKATLRGYNRIAVYVTIIAVLHSFFVIWGVVQDVARISRFESFKQASGSMLPTYRLGETMWTGALSLTGGELRRGDVVVFVFPQDESKVFVKRIAGLPGDVLEMRDGRLYINGEEVPLCSLGEHRYTERDPFTGRLQEQTGEEYLEHIDGRTYRVLVTTGESGERWGPERVPPGQFYVLGDNRDNSHDSRRWGGAPIENVIARVLFVVMGQTDDGSFDWSRLGVDPDDLSQLDPTAQERLEQCHNEGFPR